MFIFTCILALGLALLVSCSDPTYVVYPKDGTKTSQTDAIAAQLKGFAAKSSLYTSKTKKYGINFWTIPMTGAEVKKVQSNKDVSVSFSSVMIVGWIYLTT